MDREDIKKIGFFDTSGRKYRKFSNFHLHPSILQTPDGILTFPCIENSFQASKDLSKAYLFVRITPSEARTLGQSKSVINLRKDWDDYRIDIMAHLLDEKYDDPVLSRYLLDTRDEYLIEYNWWHDNFWGDCLCEKCTHKEGKNMLGLLTMGKRELLASHIK